MAKIIKPLNDTQIKSAKPKEKDFTLSDGNGLYLLIKSNGSKIWRFNYISPDSKKRTLVSFGSYPEITLFNARQKRDEYRSLVSQGVDPQQHKQSIQNQSKKEKDNTFYKVAERWLEQQNSRDITSGTIRRIKNSFVNYIYPSLGDIPISQLKAKDFIEALKPLECAGKLDTVKRISQRINRVMTYAVNNDLIEYNPAGKIGAVFKVAHKQNMPSLPPSELPRIMKAISLASIELQTRCLIEWQLLTITRPIEAVSALWSEIDLKNELWTIPADKMKMRRDHTIPLNKQAIRIIEIMKPISGHGEYVFPTLKAPFNKHMNKETVNTALKRMGFKGELVAHGFRSLASTALNEHGFDYDLIEVSLAHVDRNAVRAIYNRATYLDKRRDMMQWWGDFVEQASQGNVSLSAAQK
ncbi:Integrase [Gilliamella apicola SCGC AB-598-B02]|nr:Integrase [Gilliamella apicola SCGC AB-598-B02]